MHFSNTFAAPDTAQQRGKGVSGHLAFPRNTVWAWHVLLKAAGVQVFEHSPSHRDCISGPYGFARPTARAARSQCPVPRARPAYCRPAGNRSPMLAPEIGARIMPVAHPTSSARQPLGESAARALLRVTPRSATTTLRSTILGSGAQTDRTLFGGARQLLHRNAPLDLKAKADAKRMAAVFSGAERRRGGPSGRAVSSTSAWSTAPDFGRLDSNAQFTCRASVAMGVALTGFGRPAWWHKQSTVRPDAWMAFCPHPAPSLPRRAFPTHAQLGAGHGVSPAQRPSIAFETSRANTGPQWAMSPSVA